MALPAVTINPTSAHSATLIFMHGLGDSGHGWAPVMRMLSKAFPFIKFILPHAPSQPVTINGGARMPSWYDIRSLTEDGTPEDEAGMKQSMASIESILKDEMSTIPASRIIVGGFSQGGVMSLLTGLTGEIRPGAVISLSAYLPLRNQFGSLLKHKDVPVFMGHGTADYVVQYSWGRHSADKLKGFGSKVSFHSYENLDHSFNELELEDLRQFIRLILETPQASIKETL